MMRDPIWSQLGRRIEPAWSTSRADRARRGVVRKNVSRRVMVVAAGALAVVGGAFAVNRASTRPMTAAQPEPVIVFTAPERDEVTPLSSATGLSGHDRAYVLGSGSARFVVHHDEQRPFTVRVGDVLVEDVGTVFTVAYVDSEHVEVAVESGSVRVTHDRVISSVGAGTHIDVAAHVPVPPPSAVMQATARPVRDDVAPLLLAADDARATGHAEAALPPLRRVLREHPTDPRTGIAAFTLGRLLLEQGQPKEAADAFASARARGGPMAEDALAREVKARAQAGDAAQAQKLADEYLRQYPHGDRAKEVARFGSAR